MIFPILLNCLFSVLQLCFKSFGFFTEAIICLKALWILIDEGFDYCFSKLLCSLRIGIFNTDIDEPGSIADCGFDSRSKSSGKFAIQIDRAIFLWRSE